MKLRTESIVLALAVWFSTSNVAKSNSIIQDQGNSEWNVLYLGPIGQTFTAVDSKISTIGFDFSGTAGGTLTYTLLSGAGTSGSVLATSIATPSGNGYFDAPFGSVNLQVGQIYTVMITAPNLGYLVDFNQPYFDPSGIPIPSVIDYTGGEAIEAGNLRPDEDLRFHVDSATVPETPSVLALLAIVGILLFHRLTLRKPIGRLREPKPAPQGSNPFLSAIPRQEH